jgi:pyrroline-5-carboxylate reductase
MMQPVIQLSDVFVAIVQMAEALARGFVSKGVASAGNMFCFDPSEERKQVFKEFGVTPCADSKEVVSKGRLIFIAVKPQYVKTVLEEVKGQLSDEHVIVSIAAGVPLSVLEVRTTICANGCMWTDIANTVSDA